VVLNRKVEMTRSVRKVVVVGTNTDVGKTWVTCQLVEAAVANGVAVAARKIVQSFDPLADSQLQDRVLLGQATGEDPLIVCPDTKSFGAALAPPMAAAMVGAPIPNLAELLDLWPCDDGTALLFIETAGGLRSPQAIDADALDVTAWIDPEVVVIVAKDEIGVISQVRLCCDALADRLGATPIVVILNQMPGTTPSLLNSAWLREEDGFDVRLAPKDLQGLADVLTSGLSD